jgi:hypothetical protein
VLRRTKSVEANEGERIVEEEVDQVIEETEEVV